MVTVEVKSDCGPDTASELCHDRNDILSIGLRGVFTYPDERGLSCDWCTKRFPGQMTAYGRARLPDEQNEGLLFVPESTIL